MLFAAKIAWRFLQRNKLFALINVLGLTIGVSSCLTIFLIVRFESSFDKHHSGSNRIYRVYSKYKSVNGGFNRGVPAGIATSVRNEIIGLENLTGFHTWSANVFVQNEAERSDFGRQERIVFTGIDYFEIFQNHDWIVGSPEESLSKPFQVVLTEKQAKTYFNVSSVIEAVGRQIHYEDSLIVNVSGIISNPKENTDLAFTDFISLATSQQSWLKRNIRLQDWNGTSSSSILFLKLLPDVPPSQIEQDLEKLALKYKPAEYAGSVSYKLQPLSDLHFNADLEIFDYSLPATSVTTLRILVAIAFLILSIASINFINIEAAQIAKKAKEIGLRKAMGSSRYSLILHFLTQSALITFFAILLSLPIVIFSLNYFSDSIPPGVKLHLSDIVVVLFMFIVVTLLAGLYPAFISSSVEPVAALKNQIINDSGQSVFFRKALIVFQFTFAQILIFAITVVILQLTFISNKSLGFEKDAIVYFDAPWWLPKTKTLLLRNELERIPEIAELSMSNRPPASTGWNSASFTFNNGREELMHTVYTRYGDTAFIHVYGLRLLAGRNIRRNYTAKESIINETYCKQLGFISPKDALGQVLNYGSVKYPIVGVVKDFHFQSLHAPIKPVIIADTENYYNCFGIKLTSMKEGNNLKQSIEKINEAWTKIYPDQKLEYHFLNETVKKFYEKEVRAAKLVTAATLIAILISCIGLFGLASITFTQRGKEISIRRILGASSSNVLTLLSKDFVVLVVIAFALAAPSSYFLVEKWLEQFAYKTDISWWIFPLTLTFTILIATFSVCHQIFRAILINPVEYLRNE